MSFFSGIAFTDISGAARENRRLPGGTSKLPGVNQAAKLFVKLCLPAGTGKWQQFRVNDVKARVSELLKKRPVSSGSD